MCKLQPKSNNRVTSIHQAFFSYTGAMIHQSQQNKIGNINL